MAKTRAQRKAEQRRRQAQQAARGGDGAETSEAQHRTQVPETAYEIEAELAEQGADLVELASETAEEADAKRSAPEAAAPAPSRADVGKPAEVAEEARRPDLAARA